MSPVDKASQLLRDMPLGNAKVWCENMINYYSETNPVNTDKVEYWKKVKEILNTV